MNQLLYGVIIGGGIGYVCGTLTYFLKVKKEMNKKN